MLDTSFLVHCAQLGVDWATELRILCDFTYQPAIVDKTLDELDMIIGQGGKKKAAAKLAKLMLAKVRVIKTKKEKHVDALILDRVKSGMLVATHDAAFKRKLKAKGIPVIVLRQKKYLVFG